MLKRIAIVIPWFGKQLKGGAEQHAWQIATRLSACDFDVHVLTTCSKEFFSDWSVNHYEPGQSSEEGLTIHRFPVKKRNTSKFDKINAKLQSLNKNNFYSEISPLDADEELIFLQENINSPQLLTYLENNYANYHAFIFLPYLFPPIIQGSLKVKGKFILQPCLHDESYAYLDCVKEMFHNSDALFFISQGEMEIAAKLFGPSIIRKSIVVGAGVEIDRKILSQDKAGKSDNYLLYLGRKDVGKNVFLLIEWFNAYIRQTRSSMKLLLAGPGHIVIPPDNYNVADVGLVTDEQKVQLLKNCNALVNLSENESFSRVIFEAWLSQKPIIIHRKCRATLRALQDSGYAGWSVSDVHEFELALSELEGMDKEQLYNLTERGEKYAREIADWDKVIQRYVINIDKVKEQSCKPPIPKTAKRSTKILIAYFSIGEGDAVGNDILQEYNVLNKQGVDVAVYAENYSIYSNSTAYIRLSEDEMHKFVTNDANILIYHHANYWEAGEKLICSSQCRILFKYHNITPGHFFENYSQDIAANCKNGIEQTKRLVLSNKVHLFLPDSNFNAQELVNLGISINNISVMPPFHKINDFLHTNVNKKLYSKLKDGSINILFVGRIAPNKGHKYLIEVMRSYVDSYGRDKVRLNIVGGIDPKLHGYYQEILELISLYDLSANISLCDAVSFEDLHTYYLASDIFLLLSEHEGFCVPILEAQYHLMPVIALGKCAVLDTIGKEQLIVNELDYDFIAAAIHYVTSNSDVKQYLIERGTANYMNYDYSELSTRFAREIGNIVDHKCYRTFSSVSRITVL